MIGGAGQGQGQGQGQGPPPTVKPSSPDPPSGENITLDMLSPEDKAKLAKELCAQTYAMGQEVNRKNQSMEARDNLVKMVLGMDLTRTWEEMRDILRVALEGD